MKYYSQPQSSSATCYGSTKHHYALVCGNFENVSANAVSMMG